MTSSLPFREICNNVPIGVFVLDTNRRVVYWNTWLAEKTSIPETRVLGKNLGDLFPGFVEKPRFDSAIEQVFRAKSPQVLSQAFNRFLLPISVAHGEHRELPMMQQQIRVYPLTDDGGQAYALVTLEDVTENVARSSALGVMAQRLKEEGTRDPLTCLFNRRFMWEWLLSQLKLVVRNRHPLACLMLDIDHFKKINDTKGHNAGDQVLKHCAEIIPTELRGSDIVVRYGGEEFVVLLPNCDLGYGIEVAERIRCRIQSGAIHDLLPGAVTVSIGVSVCDPVNTVTGEELLKQADKQLYSAKGAGRNRVKPEARVASSAHASS